MKFLDRIEEVRRLKAFLSYEEGGLACLYGRRRVGKSRLLTEILKGRTDVVYHEADREDAVLQRERLARDVATVLEGFADVVYTDWGRLLDRWQKDAPRGSVLVLDEFPYLVEQTSCRQAARVGAEDHHLGVFTENDAGTRLESE